MPCDVDGLPASLRCVGLTWTVDAATGELLSVDGRVTLHYCDAV